MIQLLTHLTDLFRAWLPQAGDGETDLHQIIHHLEQAGDPNPIQPTMQPVVEKWLDTGCAQPSQPQHQACIQALLAAAADLHWFAPPADYAGQTLAQNYAFVRLIGPLLFDQRSLFHNDHVSVGFTIQAPNIFYPSHWHPAVEFYGILSGTGLWQINDDPFAEKLPGSFIHHPTNIPHAMETRDQPMLTVYAWIGEINTRPVAEDE